MFPVSISVYHTFGKLLEFSGVSGISQKQRAISPLKTERSPGISKERSHGDFAWREGTSTEEKNPRGTITN